MVTDRLTQPKAVLVTTVAITGADTIVQGTGPVPFIADALDDKGRIVPNKEVVWVSSNPAVAAVDSSGVVTAGDLGTAIISATVDGIPRRLLVTVVEAEDSGPADQAGQAGQGSGQPGPRRGAAGARATGAGGRAQGGS